MRALPLNIGTIHFVGIGGIGIELDVDPFESMTDSREEG